MQREQLERRLSEQRKYFREGRTLPVEGRINALESLESSLRKFEEEIYDALKKDLGKSRDESYMCELGLVYSEISWMKKHVKKLSKERRVRTPLSQFHARSFVKPSPRGNVLIMSPWNYPLLLTLDPLVDALGAGNTAIVKPSAYAPATAEILEKIIADAFEPGLVSIVTGGREENRQLLEEKFDHIFFTGSQSVGRVVMRSASEHLTPVSLELGGKSPCIVDKTADLRLAARRIVFGKFLNCGQTCVAPDYICVEESVKTEFLTEVDAEIKRQFGKRPLLNENYGRIITEKHYQRLSDLLDKSPVVIGGERDEKSLRIEPTVCSPVTWDSPLMEEEIFGPIMPIMTWTDIDELLDEINESPHPLAFYVFSGNRKLIEGVKSNCRFGGGCINDTIIHLATSNMGFGGVGESGMGSYHGEKGFECFSHMKSIVDKKTWIDLPMRYQPYTKRNSKLVRLFLK